MLVCWHIELHNSKAAFIFHGGSGPDLDGHHQPDVPADQPAGLAPQKLRHPELQVSTLAHTKQPGWYVDWGPGGAPPAHPGSSSAASARTCPAATMRYIAVGTPSGAAEWLSADPVA